jgi:phytoene desaturase
VYVHAPTRTDATMAPAGRECFYALAPVPNLSFGADWGAIGDWFSSVVLERVERMMAPGLRGRLEEDFYCTPAYFRDALLSVDGAGFGVEPRLSQSAYFRFHNRCPAYRNLFFVGAGTHPGAGVPGVLTTAKTLERVLDREGVVA